MGEAQDVLGQARGGGEAHLVVVKHVLQVLHNLLLTSKEWWKKNTNSFTKVMMIERVKMIQDDLSH